MFMLNIIRIIAVVLFFSVNIFAQSYLENDFEISRKNFSLKLRDGIKLDCTKIFPLTDKPSGGLPCIVYCHGFGKSKEDNLSNAIIFSKFGFVTYTYSMRGQGFSEGKSNLISITEAQDLKEVIAYIKKDTLIDSNKIAVIGSSQGGIIPLMSVCMGLDVRCLISDLISTDFASNWIENGCVKMSLLWSLSYNDKIVRYSDEVKSYRSWIFSKRKDKWDSLCYCLPKNRDFSNKISSINKPVFISNSFQDKYFSSNGIIENLHKFPSNSRFYFGGIEGHGSYPAEDEIDYHDRNMNYWLDYWLNNIPPAENKKFTVSFSRQPYLNNIWSYNRFCSDTSLFDKNSPIKFYFHSSKYITETPYKGDTSSFIFMNPVNDTIYNLQEAVNSEFKGEYFNSNFKKTSIVFESEPLVWNYNVLGIPVLHIVYKSNKSVCQFNFQIYEVFSDGTGKFISSINYTDRNCKKDIIKKADVKGDAFGHIFSAHSKIRIILTNLDTRENDSFLRTNPYVLPIFNSSVNTIYVGGKDGSFIKIPLKE